MLVVAAFELGDPVSFVVPMKTDDALFHRWLVQGVRVAVQQASAAAAVAADARQAAVRTWFHRSHSRT